MSGLLQFFQRGQLHRVNRTRFFGLGPLFPERKVDQIAVKPEGAQVLHQNFGTVAGWGYPQGGTGFGFGFETSQTRPDRSPGGPNYSLNHQILAFGDAFSEVFYLGPPGQQLQKLLDRGG